MNEILVTPRSLSAGDDPSLRRLVEAGYSLRFGPVGRTPGEAELLHLLPGCIGWIAGVEPVSETVVARAAPTLRVISRNGVGVDNLPLSACDRLGVEVRRADGANAQGVAELTIALILAALRQIAFSDAALKRGAWERRRGVELRGATVGVVGLGAIGRRVARMASDLGAVVLACDPVAPPLDIAANVTRTDFDAVVARASVITLHCPPLPSGAALIDGTTLGRMSPGVFLVNTARASLIDETAVLDALESGRLACYATDVFDVEPPGASRLVLSDRVIATPHIGGYTLESVAEASRVAVANLLESLEAAHAVPA